MIKHCVCINWTKRMRPADSIRVRIRCERVAATVAILVFALLSAISLPRMETALVFISITFVALLAGAIAWIITERRAAKPCDRPEVSAWNSAGRNTDVAPARLERDQKYIAYLERRCLALRVGWCRPFTD